MWGGGIERGKVWGEWDREGEGVGSGIERGKVWGGMEETWEREGR